MRVFVCFQLFTSVLMSGIVTESMNWVLHFFICSGSFCLIITKVLLIIKDYFLFFLVFCFFLLFFETGFAV